MNITHMMTRLSLTGFSSARTVRAVATKVSTSSTTTAAAKPAGSEELPPPTLTPPPTQPPFVSDARKPVVPRDYRLMYPEFLPDPKIEWRNSVREKLERTDMLHRR